MGVPNRPLRQIKRELRVRNVEMVDKYFAEYFCIDLVPGSEVRFAETKGRIQGRISDLRQTGEYLL